MRPRRPFLLELSEPANALAFRFSSRTPVAVRQQNELESVSHGAFALQAGLTRLIQTD